MSKKEKKTHFGKRLWNSITEPLPDDNDENQSNEQIPLAYDLKDSAANSAQAEAEAKSTINPPKRSQAAAEEKQPVESVIEPDKIIGKSQGAASAANSTTQPRSQAAQSAGAPQSQAASQGSATSAAASQRAKAIPNAAAAPGQTNRHRAQTGGSSAANTSQAAAEQAAPSTGSAGQQTIRVSAVESDDEDQPELPLSREELYGDQQPNGGQEPKRDSAAPQSRMARHHEQSEERVPEFDFETPETPEESVHNPHLKKKRRRYNWKLALTGVAILVIAAAGALFMWNRAKTTQAHAKENAQELVAQIYTSKAQRDIRKSVTRAQVQELQTSIDEMKDSKDKDQLQTQHDYASKMLTTRTTYQKLRNSDGLIKASVTPDTITKAEQQLTTAGLTRHKADFAKQYQKRFTATGKTVTKVATYHKDFKKLYTKKGALKASTASTTVNAVQKHLKAYREKSQLAANDYKQLRADRKALAKKNAKAAASSSAASSSVVESSSSESSSSYSEPESSSSSYSTEYSSSESTATTSDYNNNYTGGNDTATSSTHSGTTTGTDTDDSTGNGGGSTGTDSTTTGTGTDSTSAGADSTTTGGGTTSNTTAQ
ncbi:hypothetical protein [Lactiplantibacillus modestisalitolerans]|uniref:Cell surface protein n=1 Tax=Lactiplantibacillus modestisalitolerans TaxID=1457219 RepID=A0ABV5WX13_9LACO|nr:hypothetical protein [Lactiplantibacillus modestisalitolerans]